VLDLGSVQLLFPDQSHHSSWGTDDNVWALFLVGEQFLVGRDGGSTVEYTGSDIGHELGETSKLVSDLVSQFSRVAENDDRDLSIDGLTGDQPERNKKGSDDLHLLQGGEDKDGSLTHTRLCLTEDVGTEDSLGDTFLLN